jgi:ABC-type amino acid transport substrate-binding protein
MKRILLAALLLTFSFPAFAAERERGSVYDRVISTGKLRCGYVVYAPAVMKDANTSVMSGIVYDVMEEAGHLLGIEIEWTEEIGWGNTVEAIRSGRVDAICVGFWQNPAEGKFLGFTISLWYSAVNGFVREGDNRFDGDLSHINAPNVRIAASDGEMAEIIARQDFPQAQLLSHPNMTSVTEQLLDVKTGKADITFVENYLANEFIAANPGSVKNITKANPVRIFGNTIAVPLGDTKLQSMLNSALVQIINSGLMDKIIQKYEKYPSSLYQIAKPYQAPK